MSSPSPDRRNIEAAREVALQFRELTGIGDDANPAAAWTDTLAELIAALHHLADEEIGKGSFAVCLERAAFNYAYALRCGWRASMSEPIVRLIPHGEEAHLETRLCPGCRAFLDELEQLDRQVLGLCARGLAEVVSTDHRGERSYRLTAAGHRWLERQKARRGESR